MPRIHQRAPVEKGRMSSGAGRPSRWKNQDKTPVPDPAAVPLGTDEEAGGTPPTAEQVAAAAQFEMAQRVLRGDDRTSNAVILIAILLTAVVTIAAILWTRH